MSFRVLCTFLAAALLVFAQQSRPLTATVSRATINVGESATVAFSGGQLDVAGGNIIDSIGTEFAHAVELERLDRARFSVKGLAPCDCALTFTDGKNKTTVKIRVVKK
ncbi:MAG: hypothetical protein HY822_07620 [Acidobacteria bacterium]|nr:hypothetical protein [Acidobacteriota bacterium]